MEWFSLLDFVAGFAACEVLHYYVTERKVRGAMVVRMQPVSDVCWRAVVKFGNGKSVKYLGERDVWREEDSGKSVVGALQNMLVVRWFAEANEGPQHLKAVQDDRE